ncbi:MAG: hypothetical protein XE08_0190 [Parcubacteria bacterium 32_520]|nr:MAG: hypothetical protein XE08_0190 [Parcubacteria bacterium 32_520]
MTIKQQKILKGVWIASQYGLSIALISVLDYLMGLDWGMAGSVGSVLIPLLINTIRQAIKPENNDMSKV